VIEQTAKEWKAHQLLSAFIILCGIGLAVFGAANTGAGNIDPIALTVSGSRWWDSSGTSLLTRAWWHHG
jgi:hypothetical protein